jgi:hypothetical protein
MQVTLERRECGGDYGLVNGRHHQGQGNYGENEIPPGLRIAAGRQDFADWRPAIWWRAAGEGFVSFVVR